MRASDRALWLDGYATAIRRIYATADQEPAILRDFMEPAEEQVDAEIAALRPHLDWLNREEDARRKREQERTDTGA